MFKGLAIFELYDGTWMIGQMIEVSISAHHEKINGIYCDGYCKFYVIWQGTLEEVKKHWEERTMKPLPWISDK